MLRHLLNPKHLTPINRKQTGFEQKSDPHNRYTNSSFPLPGSGIGWSPAAWSRTVCSLPTSHYTRFTLTQAPCLCINGQHCIIKMSSWTVCYV